MIVIFVLEHHHRIIDQIIIIKRPSLDQLFWMALTDLPTYVSKKEPAPNIMRICVGVTELMVDTMISGPGVYWFL